MPKIGTAEVDVHVLDITAQEYSGMVTTMESDPQVIVTTMQNPRVARLLHATLGCVTESGELADAMKKAVAYGKPLDDVNIKEELGDILWYIQLAANVLGTTLEEIQQINYNKLYTRYPGKFTSEAALNRDLEAERKVLEDSSAKPTS